MIKKNRKMLIITTIITLLPVLIGLILWNKLPDQMPSHFDLQGNIDGWSSKSFSVFALPGIFLGCHMLCCIATLLDPKVEKNKEANQKILLLIFWICPIMSIILNISVYIIALGHNINASLIIQLIIGILFIILGNYLPKCKQNYSIGIKVPWTLDSEIIWNKTHKMAGYLWIIGGILLLINIFINSIILMLSIIVTISIIPIVYSYVIYKKEQTNSSNTNSK